MIIALKNRNKKVNKLNFCIKMALLADYSDQTNNMCVNIIKLINILIIFKHFYFFQRL